MVEALHASGYLTGLKRQLQSKWPKLPAADVDDCVAEAVNDAYVVVSSRRRIATLGAWLWKAADNMAGDRWARDHANSRSLAEAPENASDPELDDVERARRDELAEHRRAEAVRLAHRLIAAVGHGQVRDVMELIIEAVQAGEPDLPADVVADTLGISRPAARSLMSRGLDRLRAAARAEGIELPEQLPATVPDHEDPSIEEETNQ